MPRRLTPAFALFLLLLALPIVALASDISPVATAASVSFSEASTDVTNTQQVDVTPPVEPVDLSWLEPQMSGGSCPGTETCMIDFTCYESCYSQWCGPSGCGENFCSCVQSCIITCA